MHQVRNVDRSNQIRQSLRLQRPEQSGRHLDAERICRTLRISEQELHDNLEEELHDFADAQDMTYEEICNELRTYYDGYHFTNNTVGIYNPFSLLNAFKYKEFNSYWFETGTPTYLVTLLKQHHYDLERWAHEETSADILNSIDSTSTNPIPVIY